MDIHSAARSKPANRRRAIGLLAALGSIDALYLTWIKVAGAQAACAGLGDCEAVNASVYSEIAGVPVAALGVAMYVLIGILVWLEAHRPNLTEWAQLAVFGLALVGLVFSGWLTYVEIEILQAICPYCIVSAMLIGAIFLLSVIGLLHGSPLRD
ncbi:MAG: vitamin K epoxide reductase family protein [Anaerolineales bacterium]|jgi:uncharacterized membrane protein|nr:vitamin K epoxide reductase family protein [Anaerolineales bacterium]